MKTTHFQKQSGFTLVEMIVTIIIVMVVMTGATTFFINFINTQVKGVSYLNILNENMRDMQFLVRKIKQAESVKTLLAFDDAEGASSFQNLLLKNNQPDLGPYSLITTLNSPDPLHPAEEKRFLAIKDFFVFNDIVFDTNNKAIYYADTGNHVVRKIDLEIQKINIVAGVYGTSGFSESEAQNGTGALLNSPMGLALDADGNLYIADTGNHRLRKLDTSGTLTTIAGTGEPGYNESEANRDPLKNNINYPADVFVALDQTIYFTDTGNHRLRKIDPAGNMQTVAGTGHFGYTEIAEDPLQADLNTPVGITLDEANNIYFTDTYNSRIVQISAETGALKTLAGSNQRAYSGDDGFALYSKLNLPTGITFINNTLVFTDTSNHLIRKIEAGDDQVLGSLDDRIRLFAGYNGRVFINPGKDLIDDADDIYTSTSNPRPGFLEGLDGNGAPATSSLVLMNNPSGLVFDNETNLFFMDSLNNRIRVVTGTTDSVNLNFGETEIFANFVYTLIGNKVIEEGTDSSLYFRNIDYNSFVFDGINDYVGSNTVSNLQFFTPDLKSLTAHPYIGIYMILVGKDNRDDSQVSSKLSTTVSLRNYRQ